MIREIFLSAIATMMGVCVIASSLHLHEIEKKDARYTITVPPLAQFRPQTIDIATMGFRGLYDNFVEIWTIQFLMDERSRSEDPDIVHQTIMKTLNANIKREQLYILICFSFERVYRRPDLCESVNLKGLEVYPKSFRISSTQGWMYIQQRQPLKAAEMFERASQTKDAPAFAAKLANRLKSGNLARKEDLEALLKTLNKNPALQNLFNKQKDILEQ